MAKRNITYLTDALLITCVIQKDQAEQVLEAAKNAGAQGATISYAQGTGIRERMGLIGVTIDEPFVDFMHVEPFASICISLLSLFP